MGLFVEATLVNRQVRNGFDAVNFKLGYLGTDELEPGLCEDVFIGAQLSGEVGRLWVPELSQRFEIAAHHGAAVLFGQRAHARFFRGRRANRNRNGRM